MIDFDVLRSYMDNDEDIIAAVFMAFMEEHENGAETVLNLYQTQNWSELFITAHSLKGILASFGETKAVDKLEAIEGMTRNNEAPNVEDINLVVAEMQVVKDQINEYLASVA
ncbi:histidine phosphotransferase [Vibrio sp. 10N.286.49.C2]|uniref:Hpt domain-containing protein n=1 Tax=unclassified Vibrio TaxID=2614977 RepID=UPI000C83A7AA|nr:MULTISPECIES: Hpt domain-containing protein [unclassified Vibrio]PMH40711.1 histidine phosphotransferase [Vibrio sp. 10N.286.49.C2]PMH45242.1 histidine phosphotransferase [Vibrio sp. 10N.286.49.B1]PMH78248.1 histidine phosphotransferase [Vibrio sp. 10N.286.48.B7]